jgi:tRNA (guanine37-N1)-methyltransferase
MRFDVVTLFPELFAPHLVHGVTRRAFASGQVQVRLWQLRDFGDGPHARVDDRPYGGGPGMVLLAEPLSRALAAVRAERGEDGPPGARAPVVHFTPTGERMTQALVAGPVLAQGAVLVCGRYEGIDQRFIEAHVDLELSLGDFVLSGGELPALALLDAVARLQPGVLGDERSAAEESFSASLEGRLEGPQYSRPDVWTAADGVPRAVPPVLLSGDHAAVARWRLERAQETTAGRRPDLLAGSRR